MFLRTLNRLSAGRISSAVLSLAARGYQMGDRPRARRLLALATNTAPKDLTLHQRAADVALDAKDSTAALPLLESVMRLEPGDPGVPLMELIAGMRMPGPGYFELLKLIHAN